MKKIAIVLDFNLKDLHKLKKSSKYDLFVLDRLNNKIANIETTSDAFENGFEEEITLNEFHQRIAKHYKEVFCLFLSYDYCNIDDYLLTEEINKMKQVNEAKMITYLLNYKNQNKQIILDTVIELVKKNYELKEIIVRIHKIRKKESFSLNDILLRYMTSLF